MGSPRYFILRVNAAVCWGAGCRGFLRRLFRAFIVREIAGQERPVYCFGKIFCEPEPGFSVPPLRLCLCCGKCGAGKGGVNDGENRGTERRRSGAILTFFFGRGAGVSCAVFSGLLPCGKLRDWKGRFTVLGKSFTGRNRAFLSRLCACVYVAVNAARERAALMIWENRVEERSGTKQF